MNDKEAAALIEKIRSGIQKRMHTEEQVLQLNVIQDAVNRNFFDTILWEELKRRKNERQKNDRKDHRIPEADS